MAMLAVISAVPEDLNQQSLTSVGGLPNITLRQLEVFKVVCDEKSLANGALELHSTRANIKRVITDFEAAVGRPLFKTDESLPLEPNEFGQGLLDRMGSLAQSLHRLTDTVRSLKHSRRILRLGAAGEFFRAGLFTGFLERLDLGDRFRPCYLRIENKRFQTALLNAECDVFFGVGLEFSDRLELIDLGPVPWKITAIGNATSAASHPEKPTDLDTGKWWLNGCNLSFANAMLGELSAAGAKGGAIYNPETQGIHGHLLEPDLHSKPTPLAFADWPCYRFSGLLRKQHPYGDLRDCLHAAAIL